MEFVGARKESYSRDSRKPEVEPGSIKDDQERRDFTINALAISLNPGSLGALVDPFGGILDLDRGLIRTPLDPDITFSDDPLADAACRALRQPAGLRDRPAHLRCHQAQRQAAGDHQRRADPHRAEQDHPDAEAQHRVHPAARQRRCCRSSSRSSWNCAGAEEKHGIGHKDNFYHTLQVLDNVCEKSDDLWLRWGAILHDIAKPKTKRFEPGHGWTFHGHEDKGARMVPGIFRRLKLPLDEQMKFVQKLVALHLRPIALTKVEVTDSAIRRLLFDAGDDIDALMILCRADITSKNEKKKERYLRNYEVVMQKLKEVEEKDQRAQLPTTDHRRGHHARLRHPALQADRRHQDGDQGRDPRRRDPERPGAGLGADAGDRQETGPSNLWCRRIPDQWQNSCVLQPRNGLLPCFAHRTLILPRISFHSLCS